MVYRFVPAVLRHLINDHIIFSENSEHRVVALGLSGLICGSFFWFIFLIVVEGHRWFSRRGPDLTVTKPKRSLKKLQSSYKCTHTPVNHGMKCLSKRRLMRSCDRNHDRKPYLRHRRGVATNSIEHMTSFDMQRQRLTRCPDQVGLSGCNLVQVNLSHNALEVIPSSFVCLRGLRCLHLEYNRLRELPNGLGTLPMLEELHLANNCFQDFPDCIESLTTLVVLDLSHNRVSRIPDMDFSKLDRLQVLRLSFNRLTFIPPSLGALASLRVLKLSHNQLQFLPRMWGRMVHLERLDISHNALHSITPQIQYCCSLRALHLNNNKLRRLPASLFQLFNLSVLDVSFNRLQYMPKTMLNIFSFAELLIIGNPWFERGQTKDWQQHLEMEKFGDHVICAMPRSRCRERAWKDGERSPPPLIDITATVAIENVDWKENQLPTTLHEYLLTAEPCAYCAEMVFPPNCCRRVGFVCRASGLWLPFADLSCPPLDEE